MRKTHTVLYSHTINSLIHRDYRGSEISDPCLKSLGLGDPSLKSLSVGSEIYVPCLKNLSVGSEISDPCLKTLALGQKFLILV